MKTVMPYVGQILLQVSYAVMTILGSLTFKQGLNHFVFVTYRLAIATLAITPFAYVLERKQRPPLTWSISLQIFLLACGVTISQNCYFQGVYYTSSTFGTAVINLVPIMTFVMAFVIRLEKIHIRTLRGQAKVVGTLVCVSGAMVMTLYKGTAISHSSSPFAYQKAINPHGSESDGNNIVLGYILVFGGLIAWSALLTFQGPVMKRYPPQLSMTALVCVFASLQSGLIGIIAEHNNLGIWHVQRKVELLTLLYTGTIFSALGIFVQAWCIQKRGPVFVGVFNPVCTISTALLEFYILHVPLHIGSVVGAILIITGLYLALWGKAKDHVNIDNISTADGESKDLKDNSAQNLQKEDSDT